MISPLRVVFIASEAASFAKTGGLADVADSLPEALRRLNVDIRVVLPGYRQVFEHGLRHELACPNLHTWLGTQCLTFQVRKLLVENDAPIYVIDREDMFDLPHLYGDGDGDYYDNAERFIFFLSRRCLAGAFLGFYPRCDPLQRLAYRSDSFVYAIWTGVSSIQNPFYGT
ncbi:MAG: glycogen/starch synthase [Pseudomonadota bacterium]